PAGGEALKTGGADPSSPRGSAGPYKREKLPCTRRRPLPPSAALAVGSDQAPPRRPGASTYRCSLPGLTGVADSCRAGPDRQRHLPGPDPEGIWPRAGIQPRYSGLRVQGAATSPPSTATAIIAEAPAGVNFAAAARAGATRRFSSPLRGHAPKSEASCR